MVSARPTSPRRYPPFPCVSQWQLARYTVPVDGISCERFPPSPSSTEYLILATDALICYTWNFLSPSCSSRTISKEIGTGGLRKKREKRCFCSPVRETLRRRCGFNIDRISCLALRSRVLVFASYIRMDIIIVMVWSFFRLLCLEEGERDWFVFRATSKLGEGGVDPINYNH